MKKTSILRKKYNAPQTNQSHFQTNSRITTEHIQNPNQRLSNHNPTRNTSESIQVKVLRGSICICKEAASRMQILTKWLGVHPSSTFRDIVRLRLSQRGAVDTFCAPTSNDQKAMSLCERFAAIHDLRTCSQP